MGMKVSREDDELIASPQMKKASKMGLATPKGASTTQADMNAAMAKASKNNTLGVGFGGEPRAVSQIAKRPR